MTIKGRVQHVVRPYHSYTLDPFDFPFSSILISITVTNQGSHISFGQQRAGGCSEACAHECAKPSTLCLTATRTDCCLGAVSLLLLYGFCIVHLSGGNGWSILEGQLSEGAHIKGRCSVEITYQ